MKLLRATIYGFGKWVDYSIDFTNEPAMIIYGENESGKSTIQTFILFMLFGMPPRKRAFYRPKTSGKMGGRLVIEDQEAGEFTIERFDEVKNGAAVCYTADGNEHDEEWLKKRLHGMTYETYHSIFAFSALDLNNLQDMRDEDIGEILLGIGLTGSANIYAIEKQLDKKISELFKPYGKKPVINKQLETVKQLEKELQIYRENESDYTERKKTAADLSEALSGKKAELENERRQLHTIEKKQHALPLIQEYQFNKERMKEFPEEIPFPENGVERMEKQKELLMPLQSEYDFLRNNEKKYKQQMIHNKEQLKEQSAYLKAKEIAEEKPAYLAKQSELEQMNSGIRKKETQLQTKLDQLRIEMDPEDLSGLTFPFYIENTWNQLKKDAEQLDLEKEQLHEEKMALKQERIYLLNQIQELEDHLLAEEKFQELNEKVTISKEDDLRKKLQEENERRQTNWKRIQEQEQKKRQIGLVGFSTIALFAGFIAFFSDLNWLYPVMVFMFILGVGQWLLGKRSIDKMEKLFSADKYQQSKSVTAEELADIERLLNEHQQRIAELASLKERLKANDIERIKSAEREKSCAEKEKRWQSMVQENYENYPFLKCIHITYWPELFHRLESLMLGYDELITDRVRLGDIKQQIDEYEQKMTVFMDEYQLDSRLNSATDQLERIVSFVSEYETSTKQLKEQQQLIEETVEKMMDISQKMKVYEKAINQLLNQAEVTTIDAFYKQATRLREKEEIESSIEKIHTQLQTVFTGTEWKRWLGEPISEQSLEWSQTKKKQHIQELEQQIEVLHRQLADTSAELASMESSESYSTTLQQFEMEKEELQKIAMDWSIFKTAKEMLTQTKRNYRDKYLTKVIEQTSIFFRILTGNKYKHIFAPSEDTPFQVLAADGIRYTAGELSKGTIDQLYVSLRIAISEIMSETHKMPFMIDDAFVHFDLLRTKRVLKILREISKRHQVILFTCKNEIVEISSGMATVYLQHETQPL